MLSETQNENEVQQAFIDQPFRISDSYPPTSINNSKYLSEIHNVLKGIDLSKVDLSQSITIREISPVCSDIEQMKVLYKEWFPISYDDAFWEKVTNQQIEGYVAELDLSQFNLQKYIVGAVLFYEKSVQREDLSLCLEFFFNKLSTIYIQTIGVINELRQYKIGTKLLDQVKQVAQRRKNIKYISLHMVEYNSSGEKFYLKNGFSKVNTLINFFKLEEKFYTFFYYCYYVNGGRKPTNFWIKLFQEIKNIIRKIIDYITNLY